MWRKQWIPSPPSETRAYQINPPLRPLGEYKYNTLIWAGQQIRVGGGPLLVMVSNVQEIVFLRNWNIYEHPIVAEEQWLKFESRSLIKFDLYFIF